MVTHVAPLALCGSQPVCVVMAAGILAMLNMHAHGIAVPEAAGVASDAVAAVLTDATTSTIASVRASIAKAAAITITGLGSSSTNLLTGPHPSRDLLHSAAETVTRFQRDLEAVLAREETLEPDAGQGSAKHPSRKPSFLAFPCPGAQGYFMQTQSQEPSSAKLPVEDRHPVLSPVLSGKDEKGLPMEKMKELWDKALAYPKGTEYRRTYLEYIDGLVKDACAIGTMGAPVLPPGPIPSSTSPVPPPPPAPYTEHPVFRPWWIPRWWTGLTHGLFLGGLIAGGIAMGGMLMRQLVSWAPSRQQQAVHQLAV